MIAGVTCAGSHCAASSSTVTQTAVLRSAQPVVFQPNHSRQSGDWVASGSSATEPEPDARGVSGDVAA